MPLGASVGQNVVNESSKPWDRAANERTCPLATMSLFLWAHVGRGGRKHFQRPFKGGLP